MSVKETNRKQTGRVRPFGPDVILTHREDGTPGVTLRFDWEAYFCYTDSQVIALMIDDLEQAYDHLTITGSA